MRAIIRIILIQTILPLCLMSCGKESIDGAEPSKNEVVKEKFDIVAFWTDASGSNENFISFAKDGTYKIVFKVVGGLKYFISTGRYSYDGLKVVCTNNCVDSSSKTYNFYTQNGELVHDGFAFKKSGVEDNALENKLSGLSIKYGGHTIAKNYKTIGRCDYFLDFTNDYRVYKILEYKYIDGKTQDYTQKTLYHYVFYNNYLYLAEDGDSYATRYINDPSDPNFFYYTDDSGQIRLP